MWSRQSARFRLKIIIYRMEWHSAAPQWMDGSSDSIIVFIARSTECSNEWQNFEWVWTWEATAANPIGHYPLQASAFEWIQSRIYAKGLDTVHRSISGKRSWILRGVRGHWDRFLDNFCQRDRSRSVDRWSTARRLVDAYYGLFQVIIFPPNLCCNSIFFL